MCSRMLQYNSNDLHCHVFRSDYRRGMDCILDLLKTYTYHSELQVITALSTLYKSLHAKFFLACCVSNSRSLTTASKSGGS
jgi:hypothetical protein